jgi:hypothetical protein
MYLTESKIHLLMKNVVSRRLESEGYSLYIEPLDPPLKTLFWDHYRPDIVGIKQNQEELDLAIVECETHPSEYRILDKTRRIKEFFKVQERLGQRTRLRMLLVIPPRTLNRINHRSIRKQWKIWIINSKGRVIHAI